MPSFVAIRYEELNSRQQENYNFHKLSSVLADYGYTCIRLSDDWQGADLIAMHISGDFLKIQLKGRLSFDKKYLGKSLHIAFRSGDRWYVYPHDELCQQLIYGHDSRHSSASWRDAGIYNFPTLGKLGVTLEAHLVSH